LFSEESANSPIHENRDFHFTLVWGITFYGEVPATTPLCH
jgi:hypothetical protein